MKFRIRVRNARDSEVINTHDFEGWMISHEEIMRATGGNPFYERGVVMEDSTDDCIVQYIRIKKEI